MEDRKPPANKIVPQMQCIMDGFADTDESMRHHINSIITGLYEDSSEVMNTLDGYLVFSLILRYVRN